MPDNTITLTVKITFKTDQCVDCTPQDYDPTPDLDSILEYGIENYNVEDWEVVEPQ